MRADLSSCKRHAISFLSLKMVGIFGWKCSLSISKKFKCFILRFSVFYFRREILLLAVFISIFLQYTIFKFIRRRYKMLEATQASNFFASCMHVLIFCVYSLNTTPKFSDAFSNAIFIIIFKVYNVKNITYI